MPKTHLERNCHGPLLILLLGLLVVMAIPGLMFFIADWFGPVETRHISRRDFNDVDVDQPVRESSSTGPLS